MSKSTQLALMVPGMLLFVFVFAMMPVVIQLDSDGSLQFSLGQGIQYLKDYLIGIGNGESFLFDSGRNEYSFWDWAEKNFFTSLFYVVAASLIGTTIGIFVGIYFAVTKIRLVRSIVDFIGSLPDFIIVLLLQFIVVLIFKKTGILLFEVATLNTDKIAVMLPLIAMVIIPAIYMIRNVVVQMQLTLKEDYIGTAKARGLSKTYIIFYHALPNVLPFIKSDLHKLIGIIMGNLFIVEYLFNNKGIAMLIFNNAFTYYSYQYDVVVNGMLLFLLIYGIGYIVLRMFLFALGKVFQR
ncbi:ABC transporter permease subunit [Paenibacillus sp. GSMTC-2017]|uniref:ABC transporter permease subunit n=1 Tax=Paenibacillus sp. GSMTC-2017 TaxID=2794350 RepID=UPI0018D7D904|nr:ABC transporter permease subunit [Paenibacillus sp. GSMTC-2017]MBH5316203.1 ABC transporter permease subunit [Paenibacillus sp. GSMTC-2017]